MSQCEPGLNSHLGFSTLCTKFFCFTCNTFKMAKKSRGLSCPWPFNYSVTSLILFLAQYSVDLLKLNTLTSTKSAFVTCKRYDQHRYLYYVGTPPWNRLGEPSTAIFIMLETPLGLDAPQGPPCRLSPAGRRKSFAIKLTRFS